MATDESIPRPLKKSEYRLEFGSRAAEKAWNDLLATRRNLLTDAWDKLTTDPLGETSLSYPLRHNLSKVIRNGTPHERWQLKLSLGDGARIWFYVEGHKVVLEAVHTRHPNETK